MPLDTIIVIIPIMMMFAAFGAAMAWADIYSRKR